MLSNYAVNVQLLYTVNRRLVVQTTHCNYLMPLKYTIIQLQVSLGKYQIHSFVLYKKTNPIKSKHLTHDWIPQLFLGIVTSARTCDAGNVSLVPEHLNELPFGEFMI